MTRFSDELARFKTDPSGRRWLFVPYDQLSDLIGPLSREEPPELGIVVVENPWKAARRPYHRQKLALVLANMRHFAVEQAARGVAVRHVVAEGPYRTALEPLVEELGPMRVIRPAEYELRIDLAPLIERGGLVELEHEGWLTTSEDFTASQKKGPPWRMDAFYRKVRRRTGLLMEDGKPIGGKYSFDADNRQSWPGEPPAPAPPVFEPDELTIEVAELIEQHFAAHPGDLDLASLPASLDDAVTLWQWALEQCMPLFGPYEDAMSLASSGLFHTRISGLLNLHRLLPARLVADVVELDIPLASKEGFVRQVLGWREFVRHVHDATDGFRELPEGPPPRAERPGDGGWGRWSGSTWASGSDAKGFDGGACPSALGAERLLPLAFWPGHPSGLACLDRVIEDDGAVEPCRPARCVTARAHRLVLGRVLRCVRLGGRAQRAGDGHLRCRTLDDHQTLCLGSRLHQPDERLLFGLRVQSEEGLSDHQSLLGLPRSPPPRLRRQSAHAVGPQLARQALEWSGEGRPRGLWVGRLRF
jgi:deoxyribodipyrimidine photolyase-related protein